MTLEIFLPCYFGNDLLVSSAKLSTSLFHCNWGTQNKAFKIAMKLFMENTKKEIKLKAFWIFDINLTTFSKICNFAFSLFAVFQSVNNN